MFTLFTLELNYNFKKITYLINIYTFYVISFFILLLNMKSAQAFGDNGALWVVLLFATLMSPSLRWEEEGQNGYLDQWRLTPMAMEVLVLARLLVHMVSVLIPIVMISLCLDGALGGGEGGIAIPAATILTAGLCMAGPIQFAAALARYNAGAAGIIGVLAMPLAIPAILFASQAIQGGSTTNEGSILLYCYTGIVLPISILASAASLRSSH